MKRREFLYKSVIGAALPYVARAQVPCPPSTLGIDGAPPVSTACTPASFPSWYPASPGQIVVVPAGGTTITSAARADGADNYPGSDSSNLTWAWCGGSTVVIGGQRYLVVIGTGHADGSYNGILRFGPLNGNGADAPRWSVFLSGSGPSTVRDSATTTNGRQQAVHSYNTPCGVGDTLFMTATDAHYLQGGSSNAAFKSTMAGQTALASNSARGISYYGGTAHHNGKIYYAGNGQGSFGNLTWHNIASNTYGTASGSEFAMSSYVAMAVDTRRGRLYFYGGSQAVYYDISGSSPTGRRLGLTPPSNHTVSLAYDSDRDQFVSPLGGSLTVRTLDAAALATGGSPAWQSRTFTGTTPSAAESAGTFGRFQFIPELKGYINVPRSGSSVYFYRSV